MSDDEIPYKGMTPLPALPVHLNPHLYSYSPPDPYRRFSFHHTPSPLRNASFPVASNETSSRSPSSRQDSPLGLNSCPVFPEKLQQTIDFGRDCTSVVYRFACKGKLTRQMRDLANLHTGYCIAYIKYYTEVLVKDAETGRINQTVAASQWDVLQAEIRYLTNWRNNLSGFLVLEDR